MTRGYGLIGAGPLADRGGPVEADLGRRAGSNLNPPQQQPGVALQPTFRDVHDQVASREAAAGRIGGDGRGRTHPVADEFRAPLVRPEVANDPCT